MLKKGKQIKGYSLKGNRLMRKRKIVIHEDLAQRLLREIHTIYGHIGGTKCTMMLKEAFYHHKLRKISARISKYCDSCQKCKTYTGNTSANTRPITPTKSGEFLSVNFIGPYPTGRGGGQPKH